SKSDSSEKERDNIIHATVKKIEGPKVIGTISLEETKKSGKKSKKEEKGKNTHSPSQKPKHPVATSKEQVAEKRSKKRRRKRIIKKDIKLTKKKDLKQEITSEDIDKKLQETLSKMNAKSKSKGIKYRRDKRNAAKEKHQSQEEKEQQEKSILKVTEFISVSEIATMMDVPVQDIIMTCMSIGLNVSINQRLDADTISLLAEEFGFEVKFVSADIEDDTEKEEDNEKDLLPRPPIVTIMGHVDHGKTKLLDYIRKTNVIGSEAGGITQHIGAYSVNVNGKNITFLDTPGHEAFTAMRARGAQVTDIVIIVIAADDGLMPQTIEAINHAQAAGVPMIFAINKIDKPSADPERIKGQLAQKNILLEDWGGKIQSQEISAKQGTNIDLLLEKILLEAELLNLKANPNTQASGVVIESSLEKGRGYVATILVQRGTLRMKDIVVAGTYYGHAKAMFNENNQKITEAGPSTPLILLGLNGAPQAGDKFKVVQSASAAKEITTKRKLLLREQSLRTKKHITLDEIGRRLKVGNFKELNFVVKGDVDGSIEAMSDAIIKLSNDEIQINVIHKAVGQISESDVMLAAASNAVILGFQVRPSLSARQLAQKEEVEIRMYSVIYDAVNEIKDAMEGMLSPEIKEKITGSAEVKEIFKISRVGKVAGCQVIEGKIHRNAKVRIIRDGIVIFTGEI
ncbi:MAG TPA: translation initiation factor IF-2, partial [Bacteroidales bacterium]|nr:translation initiation factor IF-2 [Bacteroidales bacterium]